MKCFFGMLLTLLLSVTAIGQDKQSQATGCRKTLKIDEFLLPDDAVSSKRSFARFRDALVSGDRDRVIAFIGFPADFVLDGRGLKIGTSAEFVEKYNSFFTDYVIESVRSQTPEGLLAGWEGVSLSNGAVRFVKSSTGEFLIDDIRSHYEQPPDLDFLEQRLVCPPIVVEGRILAYNWVTHAFPGFENIYADHFIVDVTSVLRGSVPQQRIRVDFWGVAHLPEYNLPSEAFEADAVWRMYLRPADSPPTNKEVCEKDVQEFISNVDEAGKEIDKESAVKVLAGEDSLTYTGLACFEVRKQLFYKTEPSKP